MTDSEQTLGCGCCEGIEALTPASVENLPGLSALAYRVGTHGRFKESMVAALSGQPALHGLTTREDDDPAIALIDAWATVLDVLSFYQERIANEGYLRTATERRSVLEMARRIGYELGPGVAAGTFLAFTLEDAPTAPTSAVIAVGTRAQSIPGQDELPQTYETVEEIEARTAWQDMKPRLSVSQEIGRDTTRLYLKGTDTPLQPGDAILLVGDEREQQAGSEQWEFRILQTVTPNHEKDYTVVTWEDFLGHKEPNVEPPDNPRAFAFRQRASLFGHNAPDWRSMPAEVKRAFDPTRNQITQWPDFKIQKANENLIDLDAAYPKVLEDSWIVLRKPDYVELYRAVEVDIDARTDFNLTSKTTRIKLDTQEHLSWFGLRETVVFAQSEQLDLAKKPLLSPVFGDKIVLDKTINGLVQGQLCSVSGLPVRRVTVADRGGVERVGKQRVPVIPEPLFLVDADGATLAELAPGNLLEVLEAPVPEHGGRVRWHVRDPGGTEGFVSATPEEVVPEPAGEDEETLSDVVMLDKAEPDGAATLLTFATTLQNVYHCDSVKINANVARATHGEAKADVLGSGDGSKAFQKFVLKQKPLTYVSAATPTGIETTLAVRVNDVLWEEASTFYNLPPEKRAYVTRLADDGTVTVQFGDGITGARLPTGAENVTATYRVGIGLEGMLTAEQISLLMTRPLGVKKVINPLAPTGADNPEQLALARQNAPVTVLTLDRIVSLQDFEDFTSAFPGIGKAQATLLWNGERQLIHLTVAGADGSEVPATSDLYKNLLGAIDAARHPDEQVQIDTYEPLQFMLEARLLIDERYIEEKVQAAVQEVLVAAFSFKERAFGQAVTASEVMALMQAVEGVVAVDLDMLDGLDPFIAPRVTAQIARWEETPDRIIKAAQLLLLDPDGVTLTEMTP